MESGICNNDRRQRSQKAGGVRANAESSSVEMNFSRRATNELYVARRTKGENKKKLREINTVGRINFAVAPFVLLLTFKTTFFLEVD